MCEFLSWIESGYGRLIITDKDLRSKEGKKLLKKSGSDRDVTGHGFVQEYYGLSYYTGKHVELDLGKATKWQFFKLPKQIKELFKNKETTENNFAYMMKNYVNRSTLVDMKSNRGLPKHVRQIAEEAYKKCKNRD